MPSFARNQGVQKLKSSFFREFYKRIGDFIQIAIKYCIPKLIFSSIIYMFQNLAMIYAFSNNKDFWQGGKEISPPEKQFLLTDVFTSDFLAFVFNESIILFFFHNCDSCAISAISLVGEFQLRDAFIGMEFIPYHPPQSAFALAVDNQNFFGIAR